MILVVKVALARRFFCRAYTTDGPGQLRLLQVFRAKVETVSQARSGPTTTWHQCQPDQLKRR
ncbi:hypothetical protein LXEBMM8_EKPBGFGD_02142 [Lactiplantibacillus xiangfangensis]